MRSAGARRTRCSLTVPGIAVLLVQGLLPGTTNGQARNRQPSWRTWFQRSTNAFSRPRASSHWLDTSARYSCRPVMAFGFSANRLSRPSRRLRTTPASSSTRRCLLIAWRLRALSRPSSVIERCARSPSLPTSDRRVGAPSAANTTAAAGARRDQRDRALRRRAWLDRASPDMALDVLHLLGPAAVVHAEGLVAAVRGDAVEAGFGHGQQGAVAVWLEAEFDQRRDLAGVVHARLNRVRMPREGEQPFGDHVPDHGAPLDVLMTGVRNVAAGFPAGSERGFEFDPEPFAEFAMVGERAPDTGNRRGQFHAFFDPVVHVPPHGCVFAMLRACVWKRNRKVAYSRGGASSPVHAAGARLHEP